MSQRKQFILSSVCPLASAVSRYCQDSLVLVQFCLSYISNLFVFYFRYINKDYYIYNIKLKFALSFYSNLHSNRVVNRGYTYKCNVPTLIGYRPPSAGTCKRAPRFCMGTVHLECHYHPMVILYFMFIIEKSMQIM